MRSESDIIFGMTENVEATMEKRDSRIDDKKSRAHEKWVSW